MKKLTILLLFVALLPLTVAADEGMWLVNTFQQSIYPQMKKRGIKLKAGEIYNENSPALCNAVVAINGGMGSGSVISRNGLVITNHHVAYGDIHALSTPEKNYLENGFWALEQKDELPVNGTTVTFLRKVLDVTDEAIAIRKELQAKGEFDNFGTRRLLGVLKRKYSKTTPYEVDGASMWRGEKYLLFFYETYRDVRLVGAPPVKIGAFGGNQDNWGWPQHKGDFALYRVYGDKDGHPADYSPENRPITPVKVLDVSTSGIHNKDYAMVIGYPGRTNRYKSSFGVREKQYVTNPIIIQARHDRMDVILKHMEADPNVRLKYSEKYFDLSNYADYAKWENICLRRYNVIGIREAEEKELAAWINADTARKSEYGRLLDCMKESFEARAKAVADRTWYMEAWIMPSDIMLIANRFGTVIYRMQREKIDSIRLGDKELQGAINGAKGPMKDLDLATEQELMTKLMKEFADHVDRSLWGDPFIQLYDRFNGDIPALVDYAYKTSCCTSNEKIKSWFSTPRTVKDMLTDPIIALAYSVNPHLLSDRADQAELTTGGNVLDLETDYTHALYDMRNEKKLAQYPDANSTMRLTYGTVGPINPSDGVFYDSRTTINGYLDKYNPEDYEFRVDDRMLKLIAQKDWGRWGEKGQLYVNFLTDNDITGGNSGSPVLNARGQLIGLAFDGNRESMSGDIYFHPTNFKTVCVDIRFVMWIIDKYAGAGKLLDEITLAK